MMQHFVIQLDSQSAEITRLKEQISVFDPDWKDEYQSKVSSSPRTQPSSQDRESTREYAKKYDLDITNESQMSEEQKRQ